MFAKCVASFEQLLSTLVLSPRGATRPPSPLHYFPCNGLSVQSFPVLPLDSEELMEWKRKMPKTCLPRYECRNRMGNLSGEQAKWWMAILQKSLYHSTYGTQPRSHSDMAVHFTCSSATCSINPCEHGHLPTAATEARTSRSRNLHRIVWQLTKHVNNGSWPARASRELYQSSRHTWIPARR